MASFLLLTLAGCASAAHPRQGARSRQTCEALLNHSYELQLSVSTLALDDHRYQRKKIEAELERRRQAALANPGFLTQCNDLTDSEYSCMSSAKDWFTYQSCYEKGAERPSARWAEAPEVAPAGAQDAPPLAASDPPQPEEPCPALASPGVGDAAVTGIVRDTKTHDLVAGATIVVYQPGVEGSYTTITDETGSYTVEHVPPGNYNVVAFHGPNELKERCVALRGGDRVKRDFKVEDTSQPTEIIELGGEASPGKKK